MNPKNSCHVLGQASACQRPRLGTEPDSEPRYGLMRSPETSADSALSGFDFLKSLLRVHLRASASPRQRHSLSESVLAATLLLAIPALAQRPRLGTEPDSEPRY